MTQQKPSSAFRPTLGVTSLCSSRVADPVCYLIQVRAPASPQLIRLCALSRIQNLGVDSAGELFLFDDQLRQRRALAGSDVLYPSLVGCALRRERLHLILLGGELVDEFGDVRALAFPDGLDLLLLCIAQVQFMRDVAHRPVMEPDWPAAGMPLLSLRPCGGNASNNQRRADTSPENLSNHGAPRYVLIATSNRRARDQDWLSSVKFCKCPRRDSVME